MSVAIPVNNESPIRPNQRIAFFERWCASTSGRLAEILVAPGDVVRDGQPVATVQQGALTMELDLFQTGLPEGNVVEYGYDHAGRLTSIERKPDAAPSSHGGRTVYTLNGFGYRVLEELQRWDSGAWVTESATSYEYGTLPPRQDDRRCRLAYGERPP